MIGVEYIDHMGSDLTVVNAARVSFANHHTGLTDSDAGLLRYLAQHHHWTPFAHPQITLRIAAPVFVRTQCFKHKIGFVENEVSRRYVSHEPDFFTPNEWREAVPDKKQGSGAWLKPYKRDKATTAYLDALETAQIAYSRMLNEGVCAEQARMVLPQSMMTQWYWTGSLAAYARFCRQRGAEDAQEETRAVARQCASLIERLFPRSWMVLMGAAA